MQLAGWVDDEIVLERRGGDEHRSGRTLALPLTQAPAVAEGVAQVIGDPWRSVGAKAGFRSASAVTMLSCGASCPRRGGRGLLAVLVRCAD